MSFRRARGNFSPSTSGRSRSSTSRASFRPAQPLPASGRSALRGPADRAGAIVRSRRDRIHQAGRDHPLPLAWLGIRYPHRPILLRPAPLPRQGLSGPCRAGLERGEGPLCRRDHQGRGRERLRGGGFVGRRPGTAPAPNSALIPGAVRASNFCSSFRGARSANYDVQLHIRESISPSVQAADGIRPAPRRARNLREWPSCDSGHRGA